MSSKLNNLFIVNSDGDLELNKIEAYKIESFSQLMKRDKGSKGDPSGRKNYIACAELYYIYLMYDIRSLYYNLSLSEREEKGKKLAKIPDNWKRDKLFEEAIKDYQDAFELTASGNAYVVAEKSYYTITEDTKDMQNELVELKSLLKGTLAKLKASKNNATELINLISDSEAIMGKMASLQKKIMENIKMFEGLGKQVKILATQFIEEGGNLKTPVGGGEVNRREL